MECKYCSQVFNRKDNLKQHESNRPKSCKLIEKKLQEQAKKIEERLAKKYNKMFEQKEKNLSDKLRKIQTKHEEIVDQLIHVKPTIKMRKKFLENVNAQNKIQNFEKVISAATIPMEQLKTCLKHGAYGDIILFKKLFIKDIPPDIRCIRVRDFAREKYQYFDGSEWIMTTLQYIAETIMEQLRKRYIYVMRECKWKELEELDKQFPVWKYKEKNMREFDRITDKYSDESNHLGKLTVVDSNLCSNIKNGIKSMLSIKKNTNHGK